jgi:FlaA1/EpsC-like NDP-sugar epimerase
MNRVKGYWNQLRNPHFYGMILADAALFALALYAAYLIRFDGQLKQIYLRQLRDTLPVIVPLKLCIHLLLGCYMGMWRFTGLREIFRLLQAAALSTVVVITVIALRVRFGQYPRSVLLLDGIFTFLLAGGLRVVIRTLFARAVRRSRSNGRTSRVPWVRAKNAKKILVVGAGAAGADLVQDILARMSGTREVVRVLDDDPRKVGRTLHGIPVVGPIARLSVVVEKYGVDEVLIAIASASGEQIRRIVEICEQAAIPFRILPSLDEMVDGRVSVQSLREVDYHDLLGRDPVDLDTREIAGYTTDRTLLVTGAGGSIGSELCRQLLRYRPRRLILVDACEYNLYSIEMELLHKHGFRTCEAVLGRVQDRDRMRCLLESARPDVVFHAAAYKHVPLLEKSPSEAVLNNVIGSRTLMEEGVRAEVERFVLVSSDKAVCPTNVMGATKRLAELLLMTQPKGRTRFMAVRFGNVMGSSGSVLPLFHEQIRQGGPVTVTHPDITRYFMTIPEAAQLILQAGAMGQGADIFVLDMGQQVRILDMARDLIRLAGKEPDRDIAIEITGLRPGEKMQEELWMKNETVTKTAHAKILRLEAAAAPDLSLLTVGIARLTDAALGQDADAVRRILTELVPDYVYGKKEK